LRSPPPNRMPCPNVSFYASFKDVEHACQQCGTEVEDGRPFCPQCRAPQIHVQITVPEVVVPELNSAAAEWSPEPVRAEYSDRPVLSANTIDSGAAVRVALKAGLAGVLISIIIMPLIGILLAGVLAVYFYRREKGVVLPAALGARLGGAAGVVCFIISLLLVTIHILAFHAQQLYIDGFLKAAQTFGNNPSDPVVQASLHNLLTPVGLAITFFFAMLFVIVLASIGGALASVFLPASKRRL
jgi:hypothetical protein